MTGKRKRYSAEFKAKVALEAIRGDLTIAQLVAKHGVHQTLINAWKKQAVEGMAHVFSGRAEAAEVARADECRCRINSPQKCRLNGESGEADRLIHAKATT